VVNDFEGERLIQRVTVVGDEVEAAQTPQWQPWSGALKLSSAASRHDRQARSTHDRQRCAEGERLSDSSTNA
jgi:hypothetical protein